MALPSPAYETLAILTRVAPEPIAAGGAARTPAIDTRLAIVLDPIGVRREGAHTAHTHAVVTIVGAIARLRVEARDAQAAAINTALQPWILHPVHALPAGQRDAVDRVAGIAVTADIGDPEYTLDALALIAGPGLGLRAVESIPNGSIDWLAVLAVIQGAFPPIVVPVAWIVDGDYPTQDTAVAPLAVASDL